MYDATAEYTIMKHKEIYMNELSIFNSFLNDVFGGDDSPSNFYKNFSTPRVDVKEDSENYTLEMDLPGLCEKDVNIELDHDKLTIESKQEENKETKGEKNGNYILKERYCSAFSRKFTLPSDVDSDSIKASFKNGVLTILMLKKENEAPKKIAIEAV